MADEEEAPIYYESKSVAWAKLNDLQVDLMADDVEIDESMCAWSLQEMIAYLSSGGADRPKESVPAPASDPVEPYIPADPELWKLWFPRWTPHERPKLRLIALHPKGSSADFWHAFDPKGSKRRPFFDEAGSWLELLAPELPGRMSRRLEPPMTDIHVLTDAIANILEPSRPIRGFKSFIVPSHRAHTDALLPPLFVVLMDGVPYALVGHSMGSWIAFDLCKQLAKLGVPPPIAFFGNCFPSASLGFDERPWEHGDSAGHPPLSADDTLPPELIEQLLKWGTPKAAFAPNQLRRWWPVYVADHHIYDNFEWEGDKLPCPLYVTWATEDGGPTSQMVASWEAVSGSGGFEKLDLQGAGHLFMKVDEHRLEWQLWVLDKLRALMHD